MSAQCLRQQLTSFVTLNDSLVNGLRLSAANAASDQNFFLNYLAGKTTFAPLATGVRNGLTIPTARTANLYAGTNGQFPAKDTSGLISARLDHTISDNDTAFLRINYSKFENENQATGALNAVSRGRKVESPSGGILFSETHNFNTTTINELRAQFSKYRLIVTPNDPIGPEINILGFGNFGRDIFLPSDSTTHQFDLSDTVSMVRGSHTLKFGAVFQYNRVSTNSDTYLPGTFRFGTLPFATLFSTAQRIWPLARK